MNLNRNGAALLDSFPYGRIISRVRRKDSSAQGHAALSNLPKCPGLMYCP